MTWLAMCVNVQGGRSERSCFSHAFKRHSRGGPPLQNKKGDALLLVQDPAEWEGRSGRITIGDMLACLSKESTD